MLHYNPRRLSSINMPNFRRTNCIITASGIVTLCTVQYSMLSALIRHTVQYCTESDHTRCCDNTICPPEVGHVNHLTPNGHFSGRTAPLTYKCCIFVFIQQIYVLNILNMLHTLRFFLFKMPFIS
jgi:hypothetical protein